jgi:hypothetical protein
VRASKREETAPVAGVDSVKHGIAPLTTTDEFTLPIWSLAMTPRLGDTMTKNQGKTEKEGRP